MNKGFTLLELLVVVGIMGLLGTASVGGYRQMQRGMEERGVRDNVSQFILLTAQRAQIDRKPTAIYCWNEMLREATEDQDQIIVGKAVAIRAQGRVSLVESGAIYDEFGDLEQFGQGGAYKTVDDSEPSVRLYRFVGSENVEKYSARQCRKTVADEVFPTSDPQNESGGGNQRPNKFTRFGYKVSGGWKVGDRYGMEFQEIQLPRGYVFGSGGNLPTSMSTPVVEVRVLTFRPDATSSATLDLASLRPGDGGAIVAQSIGTTKSLSELMD